MSIISRSRAPAPLVDVSTVLRYGFGEIAEPLIATLDGELWKQVEHDTFAALVYTPIPEGWQVTREILIHFVASSPHLVARLRDALPDSDVRPFEVGAVPELGSVGRPAKANNVINKPAQGNSSEQAVARLRRDHPELYAKVETGEMSPNAAAVKAGFRTRTITVPLDPTRAAATLRRQFKGEDFQRLLNELNAEAFA